MSKAVQEFREVLSIKASSVTASNPRIHRALLPLHHWLVRDRAAASHCSQSNDTSAVEALRRRSRRSLLCTIPTGTLSWDGMQTSTPLVELSFGENPWASDRDLSLQEEDEDSPPQRWFEYLPVCGTHVCGNSERQGLAPLTILPQ